MLETRDGSSGNPLTPRRKRSMNIKLYKTDLRPELNEVFDDITLFLADLQPKHQWANVKYTKPELDIMIKLPLDGTYNHLGQFDYCDLFDEQANKHYYYYILNTNWKAKQTLQLQLSMDTLNTFWQEIKATLGPNTHVTRRYFDRWKKVGTMAYPLIDKHPEEISAPHMVQIAKPKVVGSDEHWTLVYMTEYSDTKALSENPTTCLVLPDKVHKISGSVPNELVPSSFPNKTAICLDYAHNPHAVISHGIINFELKSNVDWAMLYFSTNTITLLRHDGNGETTNDIPSVSINKTNVVYKQPSNYTTSSPHEYWQWDNPVYFTTSQLNPFKTWYKQFKTDPRLIKIIELPYAPFDYTETNGIFQIPNGWELDSYGALRLIDADTVDFKSSVVSIDNLAPEPFVIADVVNEQGIQKKANPEEYETKLWNSSYYSLKYIYDGDYHAVKLEEFEHLAVPDYSLDVNFHSSTGMDNSIAFEFKSTEQLDTDFGDWLVCNRSTEIAYYTNEWLNYQRYGNAIDERNKGFSIASTAVGGLGSTAQTSASLAFAISGAKIGSLTGLAGAGIGAGVGLVTSVIATASSIYKANDQINSKIDQYTHQASSVSASNDLSVFRKYGKNKLLQVEYQPTKELRDSIGRYFHLYGYSCDEYGVPNWNTRIWSEYYVMEPDFWMSYIEKDYEDDISTRMQSGFRLLHRVNLSDRSGAYDFESEYENFERSLIS